MKTRHFFTALILMGILGSCAMDDLENNFNQIDLEKIEISEHKNAEEPKDTVTIINALYIFAILPDLDISENFRVLSGSPPKITVAVEVKPLSMIICFTCANVNGINYPIKFD